MYYILNIFTLKNIFKYKENITKRYINKLLEVKTH